MTHAGRRLPGCRPAGAHLLADLYGVNPGLLAHACAIERLLRESAKEAGAQVLHSHFHVFGGGQGVTGVVLLAESHISIHTWPECSFAAADIFMCGEAQPMRALDLILQALQPSSSQVQTITRGSAAMDELTIESIRYAA